LNRSKTIIKNFLTSETTKAIKNLKKIEKNYEYSSGESDLFGMFHTTFDELDPDQKKERARYLWKLAFEKARSASKIVQMYQLNLQKMQLLGIKKLVS
jgi:hypothetical protein